MLHRLRFACGLAVGTIAWAGPAAAVCASGTVGDVTVERVWSRASIGPDLPGILYMTIRNAGSTDDALVGLSTPAAAQPMLHETVVENGVATMPHASTIPIQAGETVALQPGGYHGMLVGLREPLREGVPFPVVLTFAKAGTVTVPVDVLSVRAQRSECDGAR